MAAQPPTPRQYGPVRFGPNRPIRSEPRQVRLSDDERSQLVATIRQNLGYAVNAIICENIARQVDAILAAREEALSGAES